MNYRGARRGLRPVGVGALCAALIAVLAACSGAGSGKSGTSPAARSLTSAEAQRLAVVRFNAYQAKARSVDATVVSATSTVGLRGWIDTTRHQAYALVTPKDAGPAGAFLTNWTGEQVSVTSYSGTTAPRPAPTTGWQSMDLRAADSVLAAAQLLLVSLSSDRPENPQLLLQSGAQRLRPDTLNGVSVEVMSGPLENGATVSNLRYWVDDQGKLPRLQARLDGQHWSTFDFADTPDVTF